MQSRDCGGVEKLNQRKDKTMTKHLKELVLPPHMRDTEVKQQAPPVVDKGYNKGFDDGSDNGIEVGREERNYEIARKMKEQGDPASKIAKITGLTLPEIESIN